MSQNWTCLHLFFVIVVVVLPDEPEGAKQRELVFYNKQSKNADRCCVCFTFSTHDVADVIGRVCHWLVSTQMYRGETAGRLELALGRGWIKENEV